RAGSARPRARSPRAAAPCRGRGASEGSSVLPPRGSPRVASLRAREQAPRLEGALAAIDVSEERLVPRERHAELHPATNCNMEPPVKGRTSLGGPKDPYTGTYNTPRYSPDMAAPPPQPAFIGRERELAVLQELADSGKPELFVLYGRRRVGKTELLQQ